MQRGEIVDAPSRCGTSATFAAGSCAVLLFAAFVCSSVGRAQDKPSELPPPVQHQFPKPGRNEVIVRLDYGNDAYVVIIHRGEHDGELLLYRYDKVGGKAFLVKADQSLFPFDEKNPATPPKAVRQTLAKVLVQRAVGQNPAGLAGVTEYYRTHPNDWASVPTELKTAYEAIGVRP